MPFFLPFLTLFTALAPVYAAPQGSAACASIPANPAAGEVPAQYLQVPGCGGGGSGGESTANTQSTATASPPAGSSAAIQASPSSASSASPSPSATSDQSSGNMTTASSPPPSDGKCPAGFRNTVFNTGAARNAGWPQQTWNSLTSNGVQDWGSLIFRHFTNLLPQF